MMEATTTHWPVSSPAAAAQAKKNAAEAARIRSLYLSRHVGWVTNYRRQLVFIIFLVALTLRVAFAMTLPSKIIWEDGSRYNRVAVNLLTTQDFGTLEDNRLSVPMQPLVMAAVYKLFGRDLLALRLVWALLGSFTCLLAFLLGQRLSNSFVGVLASLILAVYPFYVYLNTMFEYPQTIFIFLMGLCFLGLAAYDQSRRWLTLFGASLSLGVAILSVPTAVVVLPLILLWLASRRYPPRRLVTALFLVLLGGLAPVTSWAVRNYLAYDRLVIVNCAGGISFWKGNNPTYAVYGKAGTEVADGETPDPKYVFLNDLDKAKKSVADMGPVDSWIALDHIGWARGMAFIKQDPKRFARLTLRKFLHLWSPGPDAVSRNGEVTSARKLIAWITYGSILLLGLLGMLMGLRAWGRFALIYGYIGSLALVYSLFLPTTRYRLPLDFFLVIFAAMFLEWLVRRHRLHPPRYRRPRAASTGIA